jgi:cell division protein FtsW
MKLKVATGCLCLCVLGLLALGLMMVYSVSPLHDSTRYIFRQSIACGLGLAGAVLAWVLLDYRDLKRVSVWIYVVAVVLLVAVLVPGIGYRANGARRWFRLFGFQFQPSDFAKLALLIALAHYGAHWQRLMRDFRRGVFAPGVLVGLVVGLIFGEPDWGTALLLAAVSGVVLLAAGVRWPYLVVPTLVGGLVVGTLLYHNPERSERIYSWLHLEETKDGAGYQVYQARVAQGKGGATGTGLATSTQKYLVPEHRTDFLYAIIGEEYGYAGSAAVIVAFLGVFLSGLCIARNAADDFGVLLGTGLSFLIGLQALINIAVVSGALPNKGLPLPFVSYGGTNLLLLLVAVGLLLSIARVSLEMEENESESLLVPQAPVERLAQ